MTTIEWTRRPGTKGETWNPTVGCELESPGCLHCYAMTMAARLELMGQAAYAGLTKKTVGGQTVWTGEVRTLPERLAIPLGWKGPRTIFVDSMSDLHHESVPFEFIAAVYGVMAATPQHTYQLLTKRPEKRMEFLAWAGDAAIDRFACAADESLEAAMPRAERAQLFAPGRGQRAMPLSNLWHGVTVEDLKRKFRIDELRQTPAAVRFISFEPLLEDLGELDLTGIDLAIAGAESGRGARAMETDWARGIRDQCVEQGVKFFYKQEATSAGRKIKLPVLDGRQWTDMP
jgi:protein gp37